jgi:hypothetical protein
MGVINPPTPPKKATSVIATHTRVVSTRKVQFKPAECDYHTHTIVILTLTSVITTRLSVI